jgi:hypothetical protein
VFAPLGKDAFSPLRDDAVIPLLFASTEQGRYGPLYYHGIWGYTRDMWSNRRVDKSFGEGVKNKRFDDEAAVFMEASTDGRLKLHVRRTDRKCVNCENKKESAGYDAGET